MLRHLIALALVPLTLTGCVAAGVAAGTEAGVSLAEERSLGTKVDDVVIYTDINRQYLLTNSSDLFAGVTVKVRHARVLLTGNVSSQDTAQKAVELAWKARGVEEVINEIVVNPNSKFVDTANDALIKKNLEGRLLITKDVWVINYSLDVVNGTAYMLGRVHDQAEMDRALNVARTTKGVKRVVNYLQIRPQNDPTHPLYEGAPPVPSNSYSVPQASAPAAPVNNSYSVPQQTPYYPMGSTGSGYAPEPVTSAPLPPAAPASGGY